MFIAALGLALASCVTASDSQTAVSAPDIPSSKYKQVAVFVENVAETEQSSAEQSIVAALRSSGANATAGSTLYGSQNGNLSDAAKAKIIRDRGVDALLYIKVQRSNEVRINNARYDGQAVYLTNDDGTISAQNPTGYMIKSDGVYQRSTMLTTKAELQDVRSAKLVWTADTITYPQYQMLVMGIPVGGGVGPDALFPEAAKEIVAKMRLASAI
jgi:hypothetical protein